jgi:hypothetical protein
MREEILVDVQLKDPRNTYTSLSMALLDPFSIDLLHFSSSTIKFFLGVEGEPLLLFPQQKL